MPEVFEVVCLKLLGLIPANTRMQAGVDVQAGENDLELILLERRQQDVGPNTNRLRFRSTVCPRGRGPRDELLQVSGNLHGHRRVGLGRTLRFDDIGLPETVQMSGMLRIARTELFSRVGCQYRRLRMARGITETDVHTAADELVAKGERQP